MGLFRLGDIRIFVCTILEHVSQNNFLCTVKRKKNYVTFQPSCFVKLALSSYLSSEEEHIHSGQISSITYIFISVFALQ